jgi:hypothetical protein
VNSTTARVTVPVARNSTTDRVSGSRKNSGSDYHVSGEGLSRNWMVVLSHRGYNIYGLGEPGGGSS